MTRAAPTHHYAARLAAPPAITHTPFSVMLSSHFLLSCFTLPRPRFEWSCGSATRRKGKVFALSWWRRRTYTYVSRLLYSVCKWGETPGDRLRAIFLQARTLPSRPFRWPAAFRYAWEQLLGLSVEGEADSGLGTKCNYQGDCVLLL